MRAKFGGDPTAGSKNLPFKFNNRWYDQNKRTMGVALLRHIMLQLTKS